MQLALWKAKITKLSARQSAARLRCNMRNQAASLDSLDYYFRPEERFAGLAVHSVAMIVGVASTASDMTSRSNLTKPVRSDKLFGSARWRLSRKFQVKTEPSAIGRGGCRSDRTDAACSYAR